ncbi:MULTISPECIES: SPFH domain-containing protein [Pseudomonas]|uniref:SPFH domain-containing protein n=1 Tax=Pseudomonas TaxID=286 RepID=UPI000C34632B|nr:MULTISPECIES: SPFH domain-containing protein [Pseudomonas]PWC98740.1 SPFH/Band 7/PHB domain protein [Pseudomonas amygdali pv. lachrymans]PWC98790.1 SPFH/Band 7/PHB domain protein [Pseudomonas amygdali pv. lachrymans]WNZ87295.1 SPFH domain-containing protein [Pseudomonas sp. P108]
MNFLDSVPVVPLVMLFLAVLCISMAVRIVDQTDALIVARIGKYHRTLRSGLNFIIPFVDRVVATTSSKDIILALGKVDAISKDNAVVLADALIVIRVTEPDKAIFGVDNYERSTVLLAAAALRSKLGSLSLDEALTSRDEIKVNIQESIRTELEDWGILLRSVEIQEITPSDSMLKAMEAQAAAERERKAAVTRAEGEKTAVTLHADAQRYSADQDAKGRLDAAKSDAAAQVELAQATAEAVEKVGKALKDNPEAAQYMLGEKFIESYSRLAESGNSKIVALPNDFMAGVASLLKGAASKA